MTPVQKLANVEELLPMLATVPPENISPQLAYFTMGWHNRTDRRTVADLAGWAARWPVFNKRGLTLDTEGSPVFENKAGFDALNEFFGIDTIFLRRPFCKYDDQIFAKHGRNITDHELCRQRVLAYLEEQSVRAKAAMFDELEGKR